MPARRCAMRIAAIPPGCCATPGWWPAPCGGAWPAGFRTTVPPTVSGTPCCSLRGERRRLKLVPPDDVRRPEAAPLDQPVGIVGLAECDQRHAKLLDRV